VSIEQAFLGLKTERNLRLRTPLRGKNSDNAKKLPDFCQKPARFLNAI
jgi:hypothetical protein